MLVKLTPGLYCIFITTTLDILSWAILSMNWHFLNKNWLITTKCCTYHDSGAAVVWVTFRCDWIIRISNTEDWISVQVSSQDVALITPVVTGEGHTCGTSPYYAANQQCNKHPIKIRLLAWTILCHLKWYILFVIKKYTIEFWTRLCFKRTLFEIVC